MSLAWHCSNDSYLAALNNIPFSQRQFIELLKRLSLFNTLRDETLKNLAAGSQQVHVSRNENVFHKGDSADSLYVVVSGQIRVFLSIAGNTTKTVAMASRGECFGVAAVWLGESHLTQAVACKDSYLLVVNRNVFLRETQRDCALAVRLLTGITQHKQGLMRDMESCAPRSSLQRVACYLLQHRPDEGTFGYDILLPTTKREIAAKLSLTQETFSRVLHQLKDMEAIDVEGRLIRVLNSTRLVSVRLADCQPTHE